MCVSSQAMFALANQIWLHSFALTQGDDQWDLLVLLSALLVFTLENMCYLRSEGETSASSRRLVHPWHWAMCHCGEPAKRGVHS